MRKFIHSLAECSMMVSLSIVISLVKIPIGVGFGGFGGSVDLVMVPIILCAARWGLGWGLGCGLAVGTLKFFLVGGVALNWESMLLDYSLAYMAVGLSGVLKRKPSLLWLGALIGCLGRFFIHFLSGITVYADYAEDIFGLSAPSAALYSLLYNGSYMLPNTILAVIISLILGKILGKRFFDAQEMP